MTANAGLGGTQEPLEGGGGSEGLREALRELADYVDARHDATPGTIEYPMVARHLRTLVDGPIGEVLDSPSSESPQADQSTLDDALEGGMTPVVGWMVKCVTCGRGVPGRSEYSAWRDRDVAAEMAKKSRYVLNMIDWSWYCAEHAPPPTPKPWPFTAEMAASAIAAIAWPGEAPEQRDEWAPKMLQDAGLRNRTIDKARDYFDAAARAILAQPTEAPR